MWGRVVKYAMLCFPGCISWREDGKLFKLLIRGFIYSDISFRKIILTAGTECRNARVERS